MPNFCTIEKLWDKIKSLPLIDVAVFDVISLLDNPDSNFEQIAEKLSPDIAANFLTMANSAYYGREVRSVSFAVRVLGYGQMKKILTSAALMDHFVKRLDLEDFNFEKFQVQAYFCAAISKVLGEILGYERPEDLYTVSILQNIGKLVMAVYFIDEYREINALKISEGLASRIAEQQILGITHGEIGAVVLERFEIPKEICNAIRFHDVVGRIVPEASGFELEFVSRASSRLVAGFALPEEMNGQDIMDRLRGTVDEGRKKYQEKMREIVHSKGGYREAFETLIDQAAGLIRRDLKIFLKERNLSKDI